MIFSELYSAYYQAVAVILKQACDHPLQKSELRRIVDQCAFGESILNIEPALSEGRWQLLRPDGTTPILHPPTMPLTTLQKRWLNAISLDPRIRLFCDNPPSFPEVTPLFTPEDVRVFDKYLDGDPYEDEHYIRVFRTILSAIKARTLLSIYSVNRRGAVIHRTVMPEYLEYSEKDDKFRLIGSGFKFGETINLGRIVRCEPAKGGTGTMPDRKTSPEKATLELEVYDQRNALERVLMHFAHFEKQAEKLEEGRYRLSITYEKDDETEMVIRVLSFGPMVKAVAPGHFVELIRERLMRQKSCGQ